MKRYGFILAVAAFILCAPAFAQQMTAPDITAADALDKPLEPAPGAAAKAPDAKKSATPSSTSSSKTPGLSNNIPVVITADRSLEWMRNDKTFIARGNAVATQGDSSVSAPTLTALYIEPPTGGGMKITTITADGGVVLTSKDSKAYGDKAHYDVDKGYAVMTGDNLKMVSPDRIVTARDKFEYWTDEGRLVAYGKAKAVRLSDQDTLEADKISALLTKNAQGQQTVDTLTAEGSVVVTTPTETATGDHGIYHASTNKAELTGHVHIHRGPNTLEGERAEVDMTTNISQIFAGTDSGAPGGGRVKGVFYPNSSNVTGAAPTGVRPADVNTPLVEQTDAEKAAQASKGTKKLEKTNKNK